MRKLKILVISLILVMFFNYFAPIVYAVENNTKDVETNIQKSNETTQNTVNESKKESTKNEVTQNKASENKVEKNTANTKKQEKKEEVTKKEETQNRVQTQTTENTIKVQNVEDPEIEFADEDLKKYMVVHYDDNKDGKFTVADSVKITELDVSSLKDEAVDISGIEKCTELKTLTLSKCTNYKVLSNLEKLENLQLRDDQSYDENNVNELEEINKIPNLKSLTMEYYNLTNYDISKLPNKLEKMSFLYMPKVNLNQLKGFSNLKELELISIYNEINGLETINNFTNLTTLKIENCNFIKNIDFLNDNKNIENLNIEGNKIEDISPVLTMSKLKKLECFGNNIKDMSVLENTTLVDDVYTIKQSLVINDIEVEKGKKLELELPQTIKQIFDKNSKFYGENANIEINDQHEFTVSDDKSKITIDTTNDDIGEKMICIYVHNNSGEGKLIGTTLELNYRVAAKADNIEEVQFKNEDLKKYILDNYDFDKDGKITKYDMAQITELNIQYINQSEIIDLTGLENCVSLKYLSLRKGRNYDVIRQLTNLEKLSISEIEEVNELNKLKDLTNLKELDIWDINLENYDISQLPTQVEDLYFNCYKTLDLTPIVKFTNLKKLHIESGNGLVLKGLEKINQVTTLKDLEIRWSSSLSNIDFLRGNNSIEILNIEDDKIEDISPVLEMSKLQTLYCAGNNIQDISVLENTRLLDREYNQSQSLLINDVLVEKGKSIEVELPQTIKQIFNPNSKFYIQNAELRVQEGEGITISEDKSKIIINTENLDVGAKTANLIIENNDYSGKLSGTTVDVNYRIFIPADKTQEVQFKSKELKKYMSENYDIDKDGKITPYDMAQITELDIRYIDNNIDLTGLEKCISLKKLLMRKTTNYDVLKNLSNLETVQIEFLEDLSELTKLKNIPNLKKLIFELYSEKFDISQLPTQIEELSVQAYHLNLTPLTNFKNLKKLSISGSEEEIKGLDVINQISTLKELEITNNSEMTNIDFLKENNYIEKLNVEYDGIEDISPVLTMRKLQTLECSGNNIQDITVLEGTTLFDEVDSAQQYLRFNNIIVNKGEKVEIDLPQTVIQMFNQNSKFYVRNANVRLDDGQGVSVNENNKIVIDATEATAGDKTAYLSISGSSGILVGTSIRIEYKVAVPEDKDTEVQFNSEELKSYLAENYDFDKDGKITPYDMAQITELNLDSGTFKEKVNLKGLEYATSLQHLEVYNATNIQVLTNIKTLEDLTLIRVNSQEDFQNISNIPNLKKITLSNVDFVSTYSYCNLPKQLEKLALNYCKIINVYQINEFTNLKELEITYAQLSYNEKIQGLESINQLSNLNSLNLQGNSLDNIEFLRGNQTIETLNISSNNLTNIDVIETISNLKEIDICSNKINDLSVIKRNLNLIQNNSDISQYFTYNIEGISGQKLEIELPQTLKDAMNPDDVLYIDNLNINQSATVYYNDSEPRAKLSEDKTKIIIDTKGIEIGNGAEWLRFVGSGNLSDTSIYVDYKVWAAGDKTKEVNIPDANFKKELLKNHDYDNDGKISEFDMAQIQSLYVGGSIGNLEGIQYAKNVNYLQIYLYADWVNGSVPKIDLTKLGTLSKLETLDLSGNISDLNFIKKLGKLKSLSLSTNANNMNELLKTVKDLSNLQFLEISGDNDTVFDPILSMTNLKRLKLSGNDKGLQVVMQKIKNMSNLQELVISRFYVGSDSDDVKKLDYTEIKNLKNLTLLDISDQYSDVDCANIPNTLMTLNLRCNSLRNINKLSNLKKLSRIDIEKSRVSTIDFIKDMNVEYLKLENNIITDISPLKGSTVRNAYLTNNPVDPNEQNNAETIAFFNNHVDGIYRNLYLTDYEKTKKVDFKNKEFKDKLVKEYDLNRDGEMSKYELEKIGSIYGVKALENTEYMTNLYDVGISGEKLTPKEQKELIEQINKLNSSVQISNFYSVNTDLGEFNQTTSNYVIDLYKACPLLVEMKNPKSKLYQGNYKLNTNEDETGEYKYLELKDNKITIDKNFIGDLTYYMSCVVEGQQNKYMTVAFSWHNTTTGDKTKIVNVKDTNFKKVLLEKYDIDKDGKFTEYDANNIGSLDISGCGVSNLSGIENLKNLRELQASDNNISNIAPVMSLTKLTGSQFCNNRITDISCLKNRKFKSIFAIDLGDNYIDFSNDSEQLKTYINELKKNKRADLTYVNYVAMSQRVGNPLQENNQVKMDAKIKQKLIALGADLNKDGKLTQKELNTATRSRYVNNDYQEPIITSLDLSNLGLTSVEGIQYLSGLKKLNLSHNKISDLTPLSKLMNLSNLNLSYNNITNISKLPYYSTIYCYEEGKIVNLSHNNITDISCISNWTINNLTDWSNGEGMDSRLFNLDLSYNKIDNISGVKNYVRLTNLNLSNNKIRDISTLKDYNFVINPHLNGKYKELLEDFKEINLSANYIDVNLADNKKAIQVFNNKKVKLNISNQSVELPFADVKKGSWYYNAVQFAYNRKIMSGTSSKNFSPDVKISRGMIVTMLHNMENRPYVAGTSKFSDVKNTSDYYYVAVKWASKNNIVSGYSNGKFGPNDLITREQLAVILNNYCKYKGKYKAVHADFTKFKDSNKISSYAKWGMNWAIGNKILNGSNGKLNPQGTATRAEAAAMLSNYCNVIK